MKKFLTTLMLLIFTSSLVVNAAESRFQNFVDKMISPITTREKKLNSQAEAQRKAREARQAQYEKQKKEREKAIKKQQHERQKALKKRQKEAEKRQKEAQKRRDDTKRAVDSEVHFWKSIFKK